MTAEERFARIENILEIVVNNQHHHDETLSILAESHIKTQQEIQDLAAQVRQTKDNLDKLERQWQAYLNTIRPQ
jgi:hypothetical protein